jgi:hypothetical protein
MFLLLEEVDERFPNAIRRPFHDLGHFCGTQVKKTSECGGEECDEKTRQVGL